MLIDTFFILYELNKSQQLSFATNVIHQLEETRTETLHHQALQKCLQTLSFKSNNMSSILHGIVSFDKGTFTTFSVTSGQRIVSKTIAEAGAMTDSPSVWAFLHLASNRATL